MADVDPTGVVLLGGGDAEVVDLAMLADGETRVLGSGPRALTATRTGDTVRLIRPGADGEDELDLVCEIGRDVCRVALTGDDGEHVAVIVEKRRTCDGATGECDDTLVLGAHPGEARAVVIRKTVTCDDQGN